MKILHELTVAITIVCCYFFTNGDRPEHAESDVFAFSKQFTVILAIVLQKSVS